MAMLNNQKVNIPFISHERCPTLYPIDSLITRKVNEGDFQCEISTMELEKKTWGKPVS